MLISAIILVSGSQICAASTLGMKFCIYRARTTELAVALLVISTYHHFPQLEQKQINWAQQATGRTSTLKREDAQSKCDVRPML